MNQLPVFFGALNYEFRMQVRRPALWITMVLLALLVTGAGGAFRELLTYQLNSISLVEMVVRWTVRMNVFFPVGVGNMLAPRVAIPTLTEPILTPAGGYMATGFFEVPAFQIFDFRVTAPQGMESLSLLLAITVLVMVVLWRLLKWQQARQ